MPNDNPTATDLRNLIAACAAVTVFGLAFGLTAPLLSLILASRDVPSDIIGLNSAMMPIGILLFSPVIPWFTDRYSPRKIAITAALITALLILAYKVFDHLLIWFVLRMLHGMSIATLFVLSEAWIVGAAGSAHRGKVVAIYASILSASFAAGPVLIGIIGIEGWKPFALGAAVIVAGTAPLFAIRDVAPAHVAADAQHGPKGFTKKAPLLVAAAGCFAIMDSAAMSLLPVYGIENSLSQRDAAFALTALIIGNVFLQPPIGWLADKFPVRPMFMALAAITTVVCLLLPWLLHTAYFWPALVIAGSSGYGVYTVSLKSLGDRFEGRELIAGSATFSLVWGVGALLGAVAGGWSITLSTLLGLPFLFAAVYLFFLIGTWIRHRAVTNANNLR